MRIVASSDWRDAVPFETPLILAAVLPGDETRCSVCGGDSAPRPRTELWIVKHRHPKHHDGYVRFYCREHVPVIAAPKPVAEQPRTRASRGTAGASGVRRAPQAETPPRAMCPDCFVEVSATGRCGMCGWSAG